MVVPSGYYCDPYPRVEPPAQLARCGSDPQRRLRPAAAARDIDWNDNELRAMKYFDERCTDGRPCAQQFSIEIVIPTCRAADAIKENYVRNPGSLV
jgi:hypothetical protein